MVLVTRVEDIHDRLVAFYPAYSDTGSITRIIYRGEPEQECYGDDPRQVESIKRALARCYAVDLSAQASLLRSRFGRQLILHFYLPDSRVFVPFKLRKRRIKGDAAYGYVDLDRIDRFDPGDPPNLVLKSGTVVPLCSNIKTARLAYLLAMEIRAELIHPPDNFDHDLVNALSVLRALLGGSLLASPPPGRRFRPKFIRTK